MQWHVATLIYFSLNFAYDLTPGSDRVFPEPIDPHPQFLSG